MMYDILGTLVTIAIFWVIIHPHLLKPRWWRVRHRQRVWTKAEQQRRKDTKA